MMRRSILGLSLLACSLVSAQQPAAPRKLASFDLQRAHIMLRQARDEVQKNYYDSTFRGVDLEKTYQQMDARLNTAASVNETFRIIAAFLSALHDSHTFLIPPARQNRSTLGFNMEMIGEKCFVTQIRPGTDAATKLHVGDQVLTMNGFNIKRAAFGEMSYYFNVLSPTPSEALDVMSPGGVPRHEIVQATLRVGKAILDLASGNDSDYWKLVRDDEEDAHLNRQRLYEAGDVAIWKMGTFEVAPETIDTVFSKVMKHKTLILDLRGNSGGYVDTLKELVGRLFDHDVKIGDLVTRKDNKPEMAKSRKPVFKGELIVLVDSTSASCSEVFSRVIQLEKRGKVLGDVSAGAVMEARWFQEQVGGEYAVFYGFSVTSANVLMSDGKSLENAGVVPDELLLPTGTDLLAGKDTVLSHAAGLADLKLDPEAAAKLFPFEWASL